MTTLKLYWFVIHENTTPQDVEARENAINRYLSDGYTIDRVTDTPHPRTMGVLYLVWFVKADA